MSTGLGNDANFSDFTDFTLVPAAWGTITLISAYSSIALICNLPFKFLFEWLDLVERLLIAVCVGVCNMKRP